MEVLSIPGFSQPFSSLSHLCGAGVFAVLSFALVRRGRGQGGRVAALAVFAASCVLLLTMSGVYHLLEPGTEARGAFRRLDHAAIFVLIAGTFTGAHAVLFRGAYLYVMLTFIWVVAAVGVTCKLLWFGQLSELQGLAFYLGMGWVGLISGYKLLKTHGWVVIRPLILGGAAYTGGAILEFLRWPVLVPGAVGPHELFHVCVLAGVALHWMFIHRIADGRLLPPLPSAAPAAVAPSVACPLSDRG